MEEKIIFRKNKTFMHEKIIKNNNYTYINSTKLRFSSCNVIKRTKLIYNFDISIYHINIDKKNKTFKNNHIL